MSCSRNGKGNSGWTLPSLQPSGGSYVAVQCCDPIWTDPTIPQPTSPPPPKCKLGITGKCIKPKKKSMSGLLIGLIIGGSFLAIIIFVLLYIYYFKK